MKKVVKKFFYYITKPYFYIIINNNQKQITMTKQSINNKRNQKGVFSIGDDVAGWYAVSRENINMITFYEGKFNFTEKNDVYRFYTEKGFAKRITELLKRGY